MNPMLQVGCRTAGLDVVVQSRSRRWVKLARESFAGQESVSESPQVRVIVEAPAPQPFSLEGMRPLTRGAWSDGTTVVLENACASGADLRVTPRGRLLEVEVRFRPGWAERALALAAPDRAVLLLRSALVQYPALWWAGRSGAVPLHVSGVSVRGRGLLLAGPGGVGKSTLLRDSLSDGAIPVSDNLCVSDGITLHGLLEPLRSEGGAGRKMPHGRRESGWPLRRDSLPVDHVLVLHRGVGTRAAVLPVTAEAAARVVTTGTYAAGELRRYWAFAATLALGTGLGPAHPPVAEAARRICSRVPCSDVLLPGTTGTRLADLLPEPADDASDRSDRR